MHDVAEFGTARRAQIEGVNICAKTGTAQNPHGKDHSLFVAFAPMEDPKIAICVVVENAGFGATWAAPIASLMMEQYLKDSISEKRKPEVERIASADLIPAAIKQWYHKKDSIKLAKQAQKINADAAPVFQNNLETSRQVQYDPEAEPNRKGNGDTIPVKNKPAIQTPDEKRKAKPKN
jgi:penicillin-binding protein 2